MSSVHKAIHAVKVPKKLSSYSDDHSLVTKDTRDLGLVVKRFMHALAY